MSNNKNYCHQIMKQKTDNAKEDALLKQTIEAQREALHVLNQKLKALVNKKHDHDKRFFFDTSPPLKQEALIKLKIESQSETLHMVKQKV